MFVEGMKKVRDDSGNNIIRDIQWLSHGFSTHGRKFFGISIEKSIRITFKTLFSESPLEFLRFKPNPVQNFPYQEEKDQRKNSYGSDAHNNFHLHFLAPFFVNQF